MDLDTLKNKKIIVYGAGQIGQIAILALREILEKFEEQVIGCAVTTINNNPKFLEGIEVHSLEYYKNYDNGVIYLIAAKDMYREQMIRELTVRNITNYQYFDSKEFVELLEKMWMSQNKERYLEFKENANKVLGNEEYILFLSRQLKQGVLNFEVNLVEHCNLNCQSCNHFSPLAEKKFLNCEQIELDLKQINKLLGSNIGKVMLLGGEPLLHPRLHDLLKIFRGLLPEASIDVVTNGLLIPKMNKEFWELVNNLQIGLSVTKYPINFDYADCEKIAEKNGVHISYGHLSEAIKTTYHLPLKDKAEFNPYDMYMKCSHANECVVLREGMLYTCPLAANVQHYNKYFNKHIPEGKEVSIDIYKVGSWQEIEEFLKRPNKMCAYCDIYHYTYNIPWAISKRDISEWQ